MADNLGGLAAQAGAGSQSLTSAFEELLKSQIANRPTPEERQGALNTYANAITSKGDTPEEWQVLLGGRLTAENPADPFQAARAALQYKLSWDKTQRETAKKEAEQAAKLRYDDILARQKSFDTEMAPVLKSIAAKQFGGTSRPIKLADGTWGIWDATTQTISPVPQSQQAALSADFDRYYKMAVQMLPEERDESKIQELATTLMARKAQLRENNPTTLPNGPMPVRPAVLPGTSAEPAPSAAPDSGVPAVISDEDTSPLLPQHKRNFTYDVSGLSLGDRRMVQALIDRYRSNPNPGTEQATMKAITELLNRGALKKTQPNIELVPPSQVAARKETEVAAAKTYENQFAENVVKPAQAFANTAKIMQDFNTLGQMNYALKNGKLKEFLAGDAGKYALSFLPENSDLRKGIANAQEAEKLTAGMVNQILLAAKGVQTEGDAQRARSQITSIGTDPDANAYLEAYISETARQLKLREQWGLEHKNKTGSFVGYDKSWSDSPIMKDAKGSVKKFGTQWIGVTQYVDKFKAKYPGATDADAVSSWNRVKS